MRHNTAGASKKAHDILNDLQSHGKLHSQFDAASGSTRERSASDVAGGHSKASRDSSSLPVFKSDMERQQSTSAEINDGITEAIIIGTDRAMGLTSTEAERRLDVFGYNELAEKESNPCLEFLSCELPGVDSTIFLPFRSPSLVNLFPSVACSPSPLSLSLSLSHSLSLILSADFWGPMPCMIWVALILEMVQSINNPEHWTDFAVLAGEDEDHWRVNCQVDFASSL